MNTAGVPIIPSAPADFNPGNKNGANVVVILHAALNKPIPVTYSIADMQGSKPALHVIDFRRGSAGEGRIDQPPKQVVVNVRLQGQPNKLGQGVQNYRGDKLSLNFQNIEVRVVLQVMATFTGLDIITSDTVKV